MSYPQGPISSIDEAEKFYNEAVTDMQHGRKDSAWSNLQQAKQILTDCLKTNQGKEAQQWLDKTNKKLGELGV